MSCMTKEKKQVSAEKQILIDSVSTEGKRNKDSFILLNFTDKQTDTLLVHCTSQECVLLFKKDTITKFWSFASGTKMLRPLDSLGFKNTFLIEIYEGDGCPVVYQILAFKKDASYYISNIFGNCSEITLKRQNKTVLELDFLEEKGMTRKAAKYIYNQNNFLLTQKK